MVENPMVNGAERELARREREDKAALKCFAYHYDELLGALHAGQFAVLPYQGDKVDLAEVITGLLAEDEDLMAELVAHLKQSPLIADRFASAYANDMEAYLAGQGVLVDIWGE